MFCNLTAQTVCAMLNPAMDIKQEVKVVEGELVEIIIQNLKNNKMSTEQAQKLASDFLAVLPITDQQDLLNKLKILEEQHPETETLYVSEITKITNQKRDQTLLGMRKAIQKGDMNSAIAIAKSYSSGF